MSFRLLIKQCIRYLARGVANTFSGRQVYEEFLEAGMDVRVSVRHGDVDMVFASPNFLTQYRSTSFSSKEPDTLSWLEKIPKNAVLWDVGANVGLYSVYAAKKCGARVISYEPSVFNLELLARNIFLNRLQDKITVMPLALTDRLGPSLFKMSSTAWGGALSSFGQEFDQHGGKLNSIFEYRTMGVTMDEAVQLLGIPAPNFIKIDVDGIEHFILRGGAETMKGVESIMIEIDDSFAEQAEESTLHLHNAGLTLLRKCDGGSGTQYNQWWIRK